MSAVMLIPLFFLILSVFFSVLVSLFVLAFWLFILAFCAAAFAFWIWMLVDCIKNENIVGDEKIAWVLAVALTNFVGALVYFFAGRPLPQAPSAPAMA